MIRTRTGTKPYSSFQGVDPSPKGLQSLMGPLQKPLHRVSRRSIEKKQEKVETCKGKIKK